jgi:hypothetical protein
MRKIMFFAVLSLVFTHTICPAAEPNDPNTTQFRQQRGMYRSEQAIINWHDGVQQMVVSPRLTTDANSLWIFPLKCQSDQAQFHLAKMLPRLYGPDCHDVAKTLLTNTNYAVIATQLWTIPICYFGMERSNSFGGTGSFGEIDANGVRIELLKADSVSSLAQQLNGYGRLATEAELAAYAKYLTPEYSLLTVWREGSEPNYYVAGNDPNNEPNSTRQDPRRFYRRRPCLYVEFPSEKPFYPVIYKDGRPGRVSLTLTGFWQLAGQEQSKAFQCNQQICPDTNNLPEAFMASLPPKDIPFTTFSLFPGNNLIEDNLSFVPGRLEGMAYVDTVSKMPSPQLILLGFVVLVIISYFAAGISGLLTYGKWGGFAAFGLLNILTIIAMTLVMNYKKTGICEIFQQDRKKANIYLVLFSVIMVGLSFAVFALLKLPLK